MNDKLMELAGDWRVAADAHDEIGFGAAAEVGRTCAAELLAILDAEGDGGAVGEYVANVDKYGGVLWVNGPPPHGTKLYTHPARSGVVSEEDVLRACVDYYGEPGWKFMSHKSGCLKWMRAALESFAGKRHD